MNPSGVRGSLTAGLFVQQSSFAVEVTDGAGGTDTVVVNVTVNAANDAPTVASVLVAATNEDTGATVDLLTGAADADDDTLNVAKVVLVSGDDSGIIIAGSSLRVAAGAYDSLAVVETEVISTPTTSRTVMGCPSTRSAQYSRSTHCKRSSSHLGKASSRPYLRPIKCLTGRAALSTRHSPSLSRV